MGEILNLFVERVKDGLKLGVTAALGLFFAVASITGLAIGIVFVLRFGQYILKSLGFGA